MENLDIIIFTCILIVTFLVLAIGTYKQFQEMNKNEYDPKGKEGGVKSLISFFEKLFTS